MQRNSATYIIGFCAVVCVVCGAVVCVAAVSLKPRQDRNRVFDQQKKVLGVAGLIEAGASPSAEEVANIFETRIEPAYINLETGEEVPLEDVGVPFEDYSAKRMMADSETVLPAPANNARVARMPKYALIYRVTDDAGGVERVVIPIEGYGLWGTLYGYLAVNNDGQTISGITYYKHIETPGLGGEVDNARWQGLWDGRQIYDTEGTVQIAVAKGAAGSVSDDPYRVDGLSGATLTSNGVTAMLKFWLGDDAFGPYLKRMQASNA